MKSIESYYHRQLLVLRYYMLTRVIQISCCVPMYTVPQWQTCNFYSCSSFTTKQHGTFYGWIRLELLGKIAYCYLTLPYLRGGQVITTAQRWGRISSAQCATAM